MALCNNFFADYSNSGAHTMINLDRADLGERE